MSKNINPSALSEIKVNGMVGAHLPSDGFKVMKIFIYLDDVTDECGPHEYASYSNNIKPLKFVPTYSMIM